MKLPAGCLIGALFMTLAPAPARAQAAFLKETATGLIKKVGIRANLSVRNPVDPDVSKGTSLGLSVGLAPGDSNGWRYPVSLTSFSEHLHSPNGESFAVVKAMGLGGGIGYGHHFGRWSTGASLQTGFLINRGRLEGDVVGAFNAPDGAVSVDVGNSLYLRPHVKAEYAITRKFGFRLSADYMMTRPRIVVTTPTDRFTDRWDASSAHASVGISFYPFRE